MRVLVAGVHGSSGIDTYTRLLATGLARAGHHVLVIDRSHAGLRATAQGVEVARLPPQRRRVKRIAGSLEAIPHQRQLRRIALEWGADVIHATSAALAPARWPPLVVNAWDPEPGALRRVRLAHERGLPSWPEGLFAVTDAIAQRRAAAVVAVTRTVAESVAKRNGPVICSPPFMLDEDITPARGERSNACVMVAGNLDDPRKNLGLAIEAVALARRSTPGLRLVLVGGRSPVGRRAELPDFCEPTGILSPRETADVLAGAGCCVLPSIWEEFGYAGLEALASGAPLVCGPLPGFADMSSGVFLSRSLEPEDFGEAISRALASSGFDFPPESRSSSAVPQLVSLYETVCAGS